MKNKEKFKDEILAIAFEHDVVAIGYDGNPYSCKKFKNCYGCKFIEEKESCKDCFKIWLEQEYVEPEPKLTKEEYDLLKTFEKGYVCRDTNGDLFHWYLVVRKDKYDFDFYADYDEISNELLKFITWEDEKPWTVEELLKLEVEE